MAPVLGFITARFHPSPPSHADINGLGVSSLELDARSTDASLPSHLQARDEGASALSPMEAAKVLTARGSSSTFVPGQGAKPASSFNNAFFLALFAIIGALMVIASLWFFFWAKNGGFHFRRGDWDDYKSTVLRRKGPDGKTLTNATKSTKLGGGSSIAGTQHYQWQKQAARSVVGYDEKGRKGILGKRGWAKTHSVTYSDDYLTESRGTKTVSDMTEVRTEPDYSHHSSRYRDRDVRQYKKEKPARVGGMNRMADGSHFGTTVAGSETMSESSEQPILKKSKERRQEKEKERAERKAHEEAARMERRWKKEAEAAAAALARENAPPAPVPAPPPPPPPQHAAAPHPRKSAAPSSKPASSKRHATAAAASPKKRDRERDFSYTSGPASEVLSTAYTGTGTSATSTSGMRSTSYYDEYRPRASEYPGSDRGGAGAPRTHHSSSPPSSSSSPRRKARGGARKPGRDAGYRRGADSDLE